MQSNYLRPKLSKDPTYDEANRGTRMQKLLPVTIFQTVRCSGRRNKDNKGIQYIHTIRKKKRLKVEYFKVTCSKCRKQYVGKTSSELRQRHYGHRREIETQSTPLGKHFAQGCGYLSWRIQVLLQNYFSFLLHTKSTLRAEL